MASISVRIGIPGVNSRAPLCPFVHTTILPLLVGTADFTTHGTCWVATKFHFAVCAGCVEVAVGSWGWVLQALSAASTKGRTTDSLMCSGRTVSLNSAFCISMEVSFKQFKYYVRTRHGMQQIESKITTCTWFESGCTN